MGFNPIHLQNVVKVGVSCAGACAVDWGSQSQCDQRALVSEVRHCRPVRIQPECFDAGSVARRSPGHVNGRSAHVTDAARADLCTEAPRCGSGGNHAFM